MSSIRTIKQVLQAIPATPEKTPIEYPQPSTGFCDPNCPECRGTGYFRYDLPLGHPKFGVVYPCPNAKRAKTKLAIENAVTDSRFGLTNDELKNLKWSLVQTGINHADVASNIVKKAMSDGYGMIFIHGGFGQGKSLVLKIATAMALRAGKSGAYANISTILDHIRAAYDDPENKMTELIRRMNWWTALDLLAIDELDKTASTGWAQDRIFRLLDDRYQNAVRQNTITLIASNHDTLDDISGYLYSRINDNRFACNGYIIHLNGNDGRRSMPSGYRY